MAKILSDHQNKASGQTPEQYQDFIIGGSLIVVAFCVYLSTMSRSISYIDGGEITTVLWTLG
ncbi:MAG: hypothetical protein ACLP05_11080, partial [Candidatus Kryptoniota bacterium]